MIKGQLSLGVISDPVRRTVPLYALPTELKTWARPGISTFLEVVTEDSSGFVLAIPKVSIANPSFLRLSPMVHK